MLFRLVLLLDQRISGFSYTHGLSLRKLTLIVMEDLRLEHCFILIGLVFFVEGKDFEILQGSVVGRNLSMLSFNC